MARTPGSWVSEQLELPVAAEGVRAQRGAAARDAGAIAVLALAEAADRFAAFAKLAGLVVGVE